MAVFSPDSKCILEAYSSRVIVRDKDSGKQVSQIKKMTYGGFEYGIKVIKFSPDGKNLFIMFDRKVYVYDAKTMEEALYFPSSCRDYSDYYLFYAHSLDVSPNGSILLTAVSNEIVFYEFGHF